MKIKKKPISKKKIEKEEDWEFDFSQYDDEDKKRDNFQSLKTLNKPRITGLRSRFSPSSIELECLERIKDRISIYGIRVASRTQEISDLWKLYGCLDEYWARIHDIFGTIILKEIKEMKKECFRALTETERNGGAINYKVHSKLLRLRNRIYIASQRVNLGLEVEKTTFNTYDKSRKGIVE